MLCQCFDKNNHVTRPIADSEIGSVVVSGGGGGGGVLKSVRPSEDMTPLPHNLATPKRQSSQPLSIYFVIQSYYFLYNNFVLLQCVYFVNSGSEANDMALFLARLYTGAFDILSFRYDRKIPLN